MAGELHVDLDAVRAAGGRLQRMGEDMMSLIEGFATDTEAFAGACGNDKYGERIAGGDNGYRESRESLIEVGRSRAESTDEYGTGLKDVTTRFEQTEADNAELFK
ncbi:hypothetical protein [Nocardia sp. NBC_00416]|uniref:hypothetical protein n=1 Tax=Nocardia sp. NBC_00416 TaxID=2975991 RepID=UPI002E22FA95